MNIRDIIVLIILELGNYVVYVVNQQEDVKKILCTYLILKILFVRTVIVRRSELARKKSTNPLKRTNWANWKATQVRSSWRERAKKYGLPLEDVPTRAEIQEWLEAQNPIKCYFTGSFISSEVVELDHKHPLCRGGSLKLHNVGITSRWYNNIKGQMSEREFRQLLKLVSKWEDNGDMLFKRLSASNHMYSRKRR